MIIYLQTSQIYDKLLHRTTSKLQKMMRRSVNTLAVVAQEV